MYDLTIFDDLLTIGGKTFKLYIRRLGAALVSCGKNDYYYDCCYCASNHDADYASIQY
jgi:hypothetical protein